MKKILTMALLLAVSSPAFAAMADLVMNFTVISNGCVTNSYWLRGIVKAVNVRGPINTTCTVEIVDSFQQVIFSKAKIDAYSNTVYRPRAGLHTPLGSELLYTNTYSTWNNITNSTGTFTLPVYEPFSVASIVTAKVTGVNALMYTNDYVVTIIYDK